MCLQQFQPGLKRSHDELCPSCNFSLGGSNRAGILARDETQSGLNFCDIIAPVFYYDFSL